MVEDMAALHITEAELARDLHAVLEKVRQGAEIIVEEGDRVVAVIKPVEGPGRPLDECIARAKAHGTGAELDEEFAEDLKEIIGQRKPLDTSQWD